MRLNLLKNQEGTSGVEFALIAPIVMALFVGVVEITNYKTVARRAEMTANSMAQLLTLAGRGNSAIMHFTWQMPIQINPTQSLNFNWNGGKTWRMPFALSQIVFVQEDASCTKNCKMKPSRDFIFAYGGRGMNRTCEVNIVDSSSDVKTTNDLPKSYVERGESVLMLAHVAQYKPLFSSFFKGKLGDLGTIEIKKITYATRYDGKSWSYPPNGHGMYKYCNGPGV